MTCVGKLRTDCVGSKIQSKIQTKSGLDSVKSERNRFERERAGPPPVLYQMECSCVLKSSRDGEQMIQNRRDASKKSREENGENREEQRRAPFASVLRIELERERGAGRVHSNGTRLIPDARTLIIRSF